MNPLQKQLKDKLSKSENAEEIVQQLKEVFVHNAAAYNEVITMLRRLNDLARKRRIESLDPAEERRQDAKITHDLLSLIDTITSDEADAYELQQAIFKRILVVCKTPAREEEMHKLFPPEVFRGVEYEVSGHPRSNESVSRFDLVVFDNHPAEAEGAPNTLLRHYVNQLTGPPYLLYFGPHLKWLGDFPNTIYFANSVFAIHARLDEMIKYLKYTRR